ncbi:MAG: hypothetical protein Q4D54_03255 [Eubacteriales bacterium]|nr:hypothetical protein [Eubacteriales bacterium]
MAPKHVMINDIIAEHNARMHNLKKYYPFFVLNETTFAQYKEGKYASLDMGYITMASLRFFINENNFHEKDVTYEEYESFMTELLVRDFNLEETAEELRQLVLYVFDKLKNDGRAFEFRFYDPEAQTTKVARVKLIDSRIDNGRVLYTITAEGIEFYLDTKEMKDESKINVSQLLLEKMIRSNNFKGGIDVVKRINHQVESLMLEKDQVVKLFGMDVFEGTKAYEQYMETSAKWFAEEQKLFAKNKALIDKAIERASFEKSEDGQGASLQSRVLEEISALETELKKTIYNHSRLIAETTNLQQISDRMIEQAKLRRLKPVFDFRQQLLLLMQSDHPERMRHVLMPFFAPKIEKSFSMHTIDNLLTFRGDDKAKGERVEKQVPDFGFVYEDEVLEQKIGVNFARLFYELLDQLNKWNRLTLKEYNGILEIKFGEEIYSNRDYYAFLVHLAGKRHYAMRAMLEKQETLLEEMVVANLEQDAKERFGEMSFEITFLEDAVALRPELSEDVTSEGATFYVTDMVFERRNG